MILETQRPPIIARRCVMLAGLAGLAMASGCTTMGTNVSGSFTCQSPDGTCAPSTVIDDGALAEIQQVSSTDLLTPAAPYRLDDGRERVPGMDVASSDVPDREVETYRLNVVFPAFVDARGEHHERAIVEADVRLHGRGDAVDALALRGSANGSGRGLLAAVEGAPPFLAIAALPGSAGEPEPTGNAAHIAAGPGPIDRIRQDIEAALSSECPRRQGASFPGAQE